MIYSVMYVLACMHGWRSVMGIMGVGQRPTVVGRRPTTDILNNEFGSKFNFFGAKRQKILCACMHARPAFGHWHHRCGP